MFPQILCSRFPRGHSGGVVLPSSSTFSSELPIPPASSQVGGNTVLIMSDTRPTGVCSPHRVVGGNQFYTRIFTGRSTSAPAGACSNRRRGGINVLSAFPTYSAITGADTRLNQIQVCPVEAHSRADGGGGGNSGMSAIQQAIFRGLTPPRFSGNEEDWGNFTRDFKEYVKVLGQNRTPLDSEILMLFAMSLPAQLKREVEFLSH